MSRPLIIGTQPCPDNGYSLLAPSSASMLIIVDIASFVNLKGVFVHSVWIIISFSLIDFTMKMEGESLNIVSDA